MESTAMFERRDDDCPPGANYYNCQGFEGCCFVDPCRPGGSCSSKPPGNGSPDPKTTEAVTVSSSSSPSPKVTSGNGPPVRASSSPSPIPTPPDTTTSDDPMLSPTTTPSDLPSATPATIPVSSPTTSTALDAGSGVPNSPLGDTAIAGISVGGSIAGLFLLFVLFLLIRRRKLSKRMPSFVDRRGGDNFQEKLVEDNSQSPLGRRPAQDDVFAPFGGRASSPAKTTAQTNQAAPQRKGAASRQSYRSTAGSSYVVSPVSPDFTGPEMSKHSSGNSPTSRDETAPGAPVQLDSRPLYFELDSADTQRPSLSELPTPLSGSDQVRHPGQLTPGFPGVASSREANGDTGQAGTNAGASAIRESARRHRPVSDGPLRGTLNASPADREANYHVGSWDRL